MNLEKHINSIPLWRRILICLIDWKAWRTAKAYNVVAVDLLHGSNWNLGNELRQLSEYKWAGIYGYEMAVRAKPVDQEKRALDAEMALITDRHYIAKLERENALLKNTVRGLKDLRRTRTMPLSNIAVSRTDTNT